MMVDKLLQRISEVVALQSNVVKKRISEFEDIQKQNNDVWFKELIFCILAANTSSKMASRVVDEVDFKKFIASDLDDLKKELKKVSCRFYNKRSEYIFEARKYYNLKDILILLSNDDKRDWLVENIKGIGLKESSHFLRNIGYFDFAILDKHIRSILFKFSYIDENLMTKSLTKKNYLEIESKLKKIADYFKITQGELDLYLWYMKTGVVLK